MAGLNLVLAARLVLQHFHFLAAAVRNDLADNFCFGDVAARDQFLVVVADGDDVVKRHLAANFAFQALHLHGLARRDAVLLSPTANYGVHTASGSYRETSIIRGVWYLRQRRLADFFSGSVRRWLAVHHCGMVSCPDGFTGGGGSCRTPMPISMAVFFGKTTSRPRARK